jgi:hypothetical protein
VSIYGTKTKKQPTFYLLSPKMCSYGFAFFFLFYDGFTPLCRIQAMRLLLLFFYNRLSSVYFNISEGAYHNVR